MTTKRALLIVSGVVAALALAVAVVAGSIIGFVFYTIDHSEAARTAKTFLRQNERLRREIGEVRGFGYFTRGSINSQNQFGNAELRLKTVGANKTVNATVLLATREGRDWRVVDAYYDDPNGKRIYLTRNFDDADAPPDQNSAESGDEGETDDAGDDEAGSKSDDGPAGDGEFHGRDDQGGLRRFDEESFKSDVLEAKSPVLVIIESYPSARERAIDDGTPLIAPKYEGRVGIIMYDLNEQPELRRRFNVKAEPTIILFKGGRERERRAGDMPLVELSQMLDKYIGK